MYEVVANQKWRIFEKHFRTKKLIVQCVTFSAILTEDWSTAI